jgi:hypothetical protein
MFAALSIMAAGAATITIDVSTLHKGTADAGGTGWTFNETSGAINISGADNAYIVTGVAEDGIYIEVSSSVNQTITLKNLSLQQESNVFTGEGALTVFIEGTVNLKGYTGIVAENDLTLTATDGSVLNTEGINYGFGLRTNNTYEARITVNGNGTFNFKGGQGGIKLSGFDELIITGDATVNASYSYNGSKYSAAVECYELTVAEHAKLVAKGESASEDSPYGTTGLYIGMSGHITVTSDRPGAITAIGGYGAEYPHEDQYDTSGDGIHCPYALTIAGTGEVVARGVEAGYGISVSGSRFTINGVWVDAYNEDRKDVFAYYGPTKTISGGGKFTTANDVLEASGIKIWSAAGELYVSSTQPVEIEIYSISGQLVKQQTFGIGKTSVILPNGIYIVKAGNTVEKIAVR